MSIVPCCSNWVLQQRHCTSSHTASLQQVLRNPKSCCEVGVAYEAGQLMGRWGKKWFAHTQLISVMQKNFSFIHNNNEIFVKQKPLT